MSSRMHYGAVVIEAFGGAGSTHPPGPNRKLLMLLRQA
jgi:hypothetical protein